MYLIMAFHSTQMKITIQKHNKNILSAEKQRE